MGGLDIALYINNLDTQNPGPTTKPTLQELQKYAADINNSGFTTGILWALHLDANGDLRYNNADKKPIIVDGQLQSYVSDLPGLLSTIKSGNRVRKLLFSLGGWGVESDFINAANLIKQYGTGKENPLHKNLKALKSQLYIDGIDIDLEAESSKSPYRHAYSYYTQTVVQLTQMFDSLDLEVTYCPFKQSDFWIDCLAKVYGKNQKQLVNCFNLMCYDGGGSNTQREWTGYIQSSKLPLGIKDPVAFVVPGYEATDCPRDIQATFADATKMQKAINGGFIWNYGEILNNQNIGECVPTNATADYASAIANGIYQLRRGPTSEAPL